MHVRQCGGGGGTPLAQALLVAQALLNKSQSAALWLLTDGRTLEQPIAVKGVAHTVIVDFDDPKRGLGRCAALAKRWGAEHRLAPF
jgi:magnesium chelatase subunit ChlD-like protein